MSKETKQEIDFLSGVLRAHDVILMEMLGTFPKESTIQSLSETLLHFHGGQHSPHWDEGYRETLEHFLELMKSRRI